MILRGSSRDIADALRSGYKKKKNLIYNLQK